MKQYSVTFDWVEVVTLTGFSTHDDQVGPFSRLSFDKHGDVITSWPSNDPTGPNTKKAKFVSLLIPLYNKIRLTFENIYLKTRLIDFYFRQRFESLPVYWDIFLSLSNEYKETIFKSSSFSQQKRFQILTEPLPRFIWIAKAIIDKRCIAEFMFDATQIAASESCIKITILNDSLRSIFLIDLKNQSVIDHFTNELSLKFFKLLNEAVNS